MFHSAAFWIAALPALIALGLWAVLDLQRFLLLVVLCAVVYPTTLISPGGTQVALVDLLLLAAIAAWLVSNTVGTTPDPWLTGNRLLAPTLLFIGVNAASV